MIQPASDKILIIPTPSEKKVGMIILPDKREKKQAVTGTIAALGPRNLSNDGSTEVPFNVSVGDQVIFHRGTGEEIEHEGEPMIFLREEFILAIVNDTDMSKID